MSALPGSTEWTKPFSIRLFKTFKTKTLFSLILKGFLLEKWLSLELGNNPPCLKWIKTAFWNALYFSFKKNTFYVQWLLLFCILLPSAASEVVLSCPKDDIWEEVLTSGPSGLSEWKVLKCVGGRSGTRLWEEDILQILNGKDSLVSISRFWWSTIVLFVSFEPYIKFFRRPHTYFPPTPQ